MRGIHVFLNAERGLAVVRSLVDAGHGIDAVHVPPGRLAALAQACSPGLAVEAVAEVNDPAFVAGLAARRPELLLIAGYSQIFKDPLLAVARLGAINLHGGLLPQYRGGSPLNWQIINGETTAGVSVIRADRGIDTGPVLAEGMVAIGPDDTIGDLHDRANALFPGLVLEALAGLERGERGRLQDEAEAVYWHQRNDDDGRIDWAGMTACQVHDLVRAVTRPYPGAFCWLEGHRLRIFRTSLPPLTVRGVPGRICHLQGLGPLVVCRDRALLVEDYAGAEGRALRHGQRLS